MIESTDGAETWAALSMQGQADFHALEVAGDRIYGYDSAGGQLLMTEDRHQATWRPTTPVSGERPSRPWRGHSTLMFVELLAVHPPVVPNPARRA